MAQESNQKPSEVLNAAKPGEPQSKTGGKGDEPVRSSTPENALGHLNPSAPEDTNTTPGSTTVK